MEYLSFLIFTLTVVPVCTIVSNEQQVVEASFELPDEDIEMSMDFSTQHQASLETRIEAADTSEDLIKTDSSEQVSNPDQFQRIEDKIDTLVHVLDTKIPSGQCALKKHTWVEIFRFSTSSRGSVYQSWVSAFDSSLNTLWSMSNRVRFTMKHAQVSQYIIFDSTESEKETWFSPTRIIETSYSDLNASSKFNFFSLQGEHSLTKQDYHRGHSRRFFLNRNYGGCGVDYGWFVVVDGDTNEGRFLCSWERRNRDLDPLPRLMFCPEDHGCTWEAVTNGPVFAEQLTIDILL